MPTFAASGVEVGHYSYVALGYGMFMSSMCTYMKKFLLLLLCVLCVQSTMARKKEKRSVVRLETSMGAIRLALWDDMPIHRDNFLKLVSEGFYDGTLFHRVIQDFMIQGGDPDSKTAKPGQMLGEGDTDYTLPAEICLPYYYHLRGALAAAREGDEVNPERRSSGCQFYIVWGTSFAPATLNKARQRMEELSGEKMTAQMYDDYIMRGGTPHLDGSYTVFGEVIEGLDIVKIIQQVKTDRNDRPLEDVVVTKAVVERRSKAAIKSLSQK